MDDLDKKEEKNKRLGILVSVGVQLFLLVLFYFIIAWKAPFPPIPEYGIELGYVTSSGSEPSVQPENVQGSEAESLEQDEPLQESLPESVLDTSDEIQELEPVQTDENEVPVETVPEEISMPETIVDGEETKNKVFESETNEFIDETNKEIENAEVVVEDEKEIEESINEEPIEVEEPTIDQRAIYGNNGKESGNDEGASLSLAGWVWDFKPNPDDTSEESGKIVYRIGVDEDGYLRQIVKITSTVSPSVERKYRQAVEKLTFSKTSEYQPATISQGTLTFIIKTK
jgi:hypothetical protein